MKTIFKYPLNIDDELTIRMPQSARILAVQTQSETPCIWALVESRAASCSRRLAVRGTGHEAEGLDNATYVGTFQLAGGALVFHVFDRGESDA